MNDQDRAELDTAYRQRLEQLLIEGIESGPAEPLDPDEWACIRREGIGRLTFCEEQQE